MDFSFRFDEEKNQMLKATRGVGFDDVLQHIRNGYLLGERKHPSPSRANQRIYIVRIGNYAYVVPFVINQNMQEIFLKTVYPNSKFTKLYLQQGEEDE